VPIRSLRFALHATIGPLALALCGNSLVPLAFTQPMPAPNLHDWVQESPVIVAGKVLAVHEIGTVETDTTVAKKMVAAIRVDRVFKGNVQPGVITVKYQEIRQKGQGNVVTMAFPNSYTLIPTQYGLLFLTKPKDHAYSPATGIEGLIRITQRRVPLAHSGPNVEDEIEAELYASLSDPDQAVALNAQQLLALLGLPAYAQAHPFKTEARLTQAVVRNRTDFPVVTTMRNITGKEQTLITLTCAFPYGWITDNPEVHIDQGACLQSARVFSVLKPAKAYTQTFEVYADLPANRRRQNVTFRLGYPLGGPHPESESNPPLWTDPLTITITR
jgi:hypothetical protein